MPATMSLSILAILAIFEIFEIPDMDNEVDNPTKHTRTLLLINPWITDFAAFDLWSKPLGLLYLANILRRNGHRVRLIDCMDRYDPLLRASNPKEPKVKGYGIGPYHKEELPKPVPLSPIPRRYFRYGILEAHFWTHLTQGDEPALVLVTSMMTYWYPGVFRAIELVKTKWPDVPVLFGLQVHSSKDGQVVATIVAAGLDASVAGTPPLPDSNELLESPARLSVFPASDPSFYEGENLDIPTFLRRAPGRGARPRRRRQVRP